MKFRWLFSNGGGRKSGEKSEKQHDGNTLLLYLDVLTLDH